MQLHIILRISLRCLLGSGLLVNLRMWQWATTPGHGLESLGESSKRMAADGSLHDRAAAQDRIPRPWLPRLIPTPSHLFCSMAVHHHFDLLQHSVGNTGRSTDVTVFMQV